jgi:hypothetical protein
MSTRKPDRIRRLIQKSARKKIGIISTKFIKKTTIDRSTS